MRYSITVLVISFFLIHASSVFAEDGAVIMSGATINVSKTIQLTKLSDSSVKIQWKSFCHDGWSVTYATSSTNLSMKASVNCTGADSYGQGVFSVILANLQLGTNYYYRIPGPGEMNEVEHYQGGRFTITASGVVHRVSRKLFGSIKPGSKSPDVAVIQEFLYEQGLLSSSNITGYYGPMTVKAVKRFQEKNVTDILTPQGLTAGTGYAGSATIKAINKLWGF